MLESIALTTPQEGGDAVYMARTMLGIDADDYEELYYSAPAEADDDTDREELMVYPNPAHNSVTVNIEADPGDYDIIVEVYDINGKLVYSQNHGKDTYFNVNVESLKNGLYFVKVTNHHDIHDSAKIMVRH